MQDSKFHSSVLGCDSSKSDALKIPRGGSKAPIDSEDNLTHRLDVMMDGQKVFKAAVKTMTTHCEQLLSDAKIEQNAIDWFIPHQANLRIIEAVARRFDFPQEKTIINVQKYANTSSASIPIALDEALEQGKIKRGDKLLMTAFGAGLSSAGVLLSY